MDSYYNGGLVGDESCALPRHRSVGSSSFMNHAAHQPTVTSHKIHSAARSAIKDQ